MREKILKYINYNLSSYDLEGVEILEEDIDDVENRINNENMSLEEAIADVLKGIAKCLGILDW